MKKIILLFVFAVIAGATFAQVEVKTFGYGGYTAMSLLNPTPSQSIAIGYDVSTNPSSYFNGNGHEIVLRNGVEFITPNAANNTFHRYVLSLLNGNVGIGTTTPLAKLTILGGTLATSNEGLSISSNLTAGRLTSGTVNSIHNFLDQESLELSSGSTQKTGIAIEGQTSTIGSTVRMFTGNEERLRVNTAGNVLIGKTQQTNANYKLDVNGKVRANEIVVNTTGADFVFENGYRLRPIVELEKFVKQNKHLPEIPTAKTMQTEGVGVSELQTKLLQKVEELSLYIIELNKKNEKQEEAIDELKKELEKIKSKK